MEALAAALLLVLVLFAALGLYQQGVLTWSQTEKTTDLQDRLRVALDTLGRDLRETRGIYRPGSGDPLEEAVEIDAEDVRETTDLFDLAVPRRGDPGEMETVRYSWAPAGTGDTRYVLRREDQASGGPQPVAHDLTYFCLNRRTPDGGVEVFLRVSREYRGRSLECEAQGTYYPRAWRD